MKLEDTYTHSRTHTTAKIQWINLIDGSSTNQRMREEEKTNPTINDNMRMHDNGVCYTYSVSQSFFSDDICADAETDRLHSSAVVVDFSLLLCQYLETFTCFWCSSACVRACSGWRLSIKEKKKEDICAIRNAPKTKDAKTKTQLTTRAIRNANGCCWLWLWEITFHLFRGGFEHDGACVCIASYHIDTHRYRETAAARFSREMRHKSESKSICHCHCSHRGNYFYEWGPQIEENDVQSHQFECHKRVVVGRAPSIRTMTLHKSNCAILLHIIVYCFIGQSGARIQHLFTHHNERTNQCNTKSKP